MANRQRESENDNSKPLKNKEEQREGKTTGENCRCEEVSKKTVPELLKIMVRDLAFWKKGR
jgi:hypothetical protein